MSDKDSWQLETFKVLVFMSEEKRQKKISKFNIACQNKKRMINAFNNQGIHIKHKDTN